MKIIIWRDKTDPTMLSFGYRWCDRPECKSVPERITEGARLFEDCVWGLFGEMTLKELQRLLKPGESMTAHITLDLEKGDNP